MATYDLSTGAARCRVTIDEELCTGTGMCLVYGVGTFDMNDDMKSFVMDGASDDISVVRAAAESCPNRAISVTEN